MCVELFRTETQNYRKSYFLILFKVGFLEDLRQSNIKTDFRPTKVGVKLLFIVCALW